MGDKKCEIQFNQIFPFLPFLQGFPYSRREATLFQGIGLFYNLILNREILIDIVALFLCKLSAIGSKIVNLLATLDFKILPEFDVV